MSIGLLIITHGDIGKHMLKTAQSTLGFCPIQTATLSVAQNCEPDTVFSKAVKLCKKLDGGDGVLVLTDMYGSTPSNIANRLQELKTHQVQVLAGINLPMLIRVLNYPSLNLYEMVNKALTGGHDGILHCDTEQ